jgi:peptidoglycan/LPS O-acetylase OafA/YrhL
MVAGLSLRDKSAPRVGPLSAWVAAVFALGVLATRLGLPAPIPDSILALPFLGLLLAAAGLDVSGKPSWLTNRWLIYAGEVSFAFYLVHELVIINLRRSLALDGPSAAALYFTVAALAAIALHHLVELPCQRLLRDKKRRGISAEVPRAQTS